MSVTKQKFGTMPSGEEVYMYTVCNDAGLEAEFVELGCTIRSLKVPVGDNKVDVILGRETLESYLDNKGCHGITVGRFANRIHNATYAIDGEVYTADPNENGNLLHSGWANFGKRLWKGVCENEDSDSVSFEFFSPDGENGFPGDLNAVVTFTLEEKALRIHYEAVANKDTIINFTNHSYFNMNGHNSGKMLDHTLKLNADFYTPIGEGIIPTGEILSVKGTPFDFTEGKKVGQDIFSDFDQIKMVNGYDHNFVLRGTGLREVANLTGDKTGLTMTTITDKPGVQIYSGQGISNTDSFKGNSTYESYQGIALETQIFPNCTEYSHFPQALVMCGDKYDYTTIYSFDCE